MRTELLFSYGTLQLDAVQMAAFGRLSTGTSDALRGFELVSLKIEDPAVIAISGKAHHTMATFTGRAWSEPTLLRLAYAFEQATMARKMPPLVPSLDPACGR